MCANPDKDRAEIEKYKKDSAYTSKTAQFHNKETSWSTADNRNVIGLNRGRSDIYSRTVDIIGQGRKLSSQLLAEYSVKDSVVKAAEGGRSRTAGRADYLALLSKLSQIENKIGNTITRDVPSAQQGINREYKNKVAMNRQKLGLPPEYGPNVMYTKQSPWEKMQPVVGAVSSIAGMWMPTGEGTSRSFLGIS